MQSVPFSDFYYNLKAYWIVKAGSNTICRKIQRKSFVLFCCLLRSLLTDSLAAVFASNVCLKLPAILVLKF